ncbi:Glucan endo-1,6-beta-glucosidase [Penicillium ucsense]|uniref:Glucan endo-1,6-beta-glucosidase n=1 Tax=Penicillium ucsense TaxID=2839758 RepID=A0A8J8VZG1_9EURO|nr:Glucan endo-1,6-beta-glucosidase [Penicillium ucsense]KAF7739056.1 Glucan endo-1,6-beta-glucosidase [Penicillium ucsense]
MARSGLPRQKVTGEDLASEVSLVFFTAGVGRNRPVYLHIPSFGVVCSGLVVDSMGRWSESAWTEMGCGSQASGSDCVMALGQDDAANSAFYKHRARWLTQYDIHEMVSYGLSRIRVPGDFWLREDVVDAPSEHYLQGGLKYIRKVCDGSTLAMLRHTSSWTVLHGASGAQIAQNAFTGQRAPQARFYNDNQYQSALNFLEWMMGVDSFGQRISQRCPMRQNYLYYPKAFERIHVNETSAGIDKNDYLHIVIQMMDQLWGSEDPTQYIKDLYSAAYDDHRCLRWGTNIQASHDSYIHTFCNNRRDSKTPSLVGEWSLVVADDAEKTSDWNPSTQTDFYSSDYYRWSY